MLKEKKTNLLIGLIILVCVVVLGLLFIFKQKVKVDLSKYNTLNLDEALKQEGIEHDFSNYNEDEKQITIYLFRGNGCHYCQGFLNFLNSIVPEYGKYFKVVSFETWYDKTNSDLLGEVSDFLGKPASGVPYIIIGDQVFGGYSEKYDESIKKAITDLYKSSDRYDVFYEMAKAEKNSKPNYFIIIFINIIVIVIMGGVCLTYMTKQHKILNAKLNEINMKLDAIETKNNVKEVKTTTKEVKQKTKKKN